MVSPSPDRIPVVVSSGQAVERDAPTDVLDLIERACQAALDPIGTLRDSIGRVTVVNVLSPAGPGLASALARRLGLGHGHGHGSDAPSCETTTIGGNTPQALVNRAAREIAAGRLEATLIAGGEVMRSVRLGHRSQPADSALAADAAGDSVYGTERLGVGNVEMAASIMAPLHVYAMIESAIAARLGRSPDEHRRVLGELLAPFSEVAAAHRQAWFPESVGAERISTPSADNRLVSDPYTKRMCAFIGSDQAAALVVCSLEAARSAGLIDRAVFVWSGASCDDVFEPVSRPDLTRSPGLASAARGALAAAGLGVDDVAMFDLYSCFPAAVEAAVEALGISAQDRRPLTVTGGLPYFGGPGNNYSTHAIATVTDRLRAAGSGTALVGALGWYITKHAYGLYGASPPAGGYAEADTSADQAAINATALPVSPPPAGAGGTIVAATVTYRDAEPSSAPAYITLDDGRRTAACAVDSEVRGLAGTELVGRRVRLVPGESPRYSVSGDGA